MAEKAELLADHYQKTFEVTLGVWEQRNLTFLILLAVVGGATLLTFNVAQAQPLLVDLIAKVLSVENAERQKELRASFPYGLIQSILLMVVLYLTLVLYHRTSFVTRSYRYLEALEREIRFALDLPSDTVAFSREGQFYWNHRPLLAKAVGVAYTGMLGTLLVAFLSMRVYTDLQLGAIAFAVADVVLGILILLFYAAYALTSVHIAGLMGLLRRMS